MYEISRSSGSYPDPMLDSSTHDCTKGGNMTDEQIIWMAQEAGCSNLGIDVGIIGYLKMFRRFAELVENSTLTNQKARWYQAGVEAEREACAKVCEELSKMFSSGDEYMDGVLDCIDAIKARGE